MRRIELFDEKMDNVGTLALDGNGSRYWGMSRDVQIGDTDNGRQWQDTFSFNCLADDITGDTVSPLGYFMWQGANAKWYLYAIQSVTTSSGTANENIMTINAVNALADDLNTKTFNEISYEMPTADTVFKYCLQNSGWEVNKLDAMTTGRATLDLSGDNAMSAFSTAVTAFNAEVDAYVEYDQYGNLHRCVDIVQHLYPYTNANMGDTVDEQTDVVDANGESVNLSDHTQGRTLSYRHGLAGFTRTEDRTQLYTRLHVRGMNDATFADINGGKDWIQDDKANDLWNGGRDTYREGTVSVDNIGQHQAIMDWGKKQLKIYNHPAFTYEITTTYMDPEDMPSRGETLAVVNFDVVPNLTVIAEVFSEHVSDDNPAEDTIMLGEVRTLNAITPSYIQNELNQLTNAVTKAKSDASSIQIKIDTPDGRDFSNGMQTKRLIMKAIEGKNNITAHIDPKGFIWQRLNQDGSYDKNWQPPEITNDFRIIRQHENLKIAENHAQKVIEFKQYTDFENAISTGIQFFVPLSNGNYVIDCDRLDQGDDTTFYLLDKTGKLQSSMIVTHGGHGSSFGVEENGDGSFNIWTLIRKKPGNDSWVARIPWQKNKRVDYQSETVKKYCHHTRYMRVGLSSDGKYVVVGYAAGKGTIYICDINDVKNDKFKPLYQVQQADFGIDTQLTFQSQVLDFPYLFMDYGDYAMQESYRKVYCVNVQTQELVAEHHYSFNPIAMGNFSATKEPEGMYVANEGGDKYLLQAFNTDKDAFQPIFKMPISVNGVGKLQEANLNGFLLNVSSDFSGTYRGMVETDYITKDSEVMIDETKATQIAQYNHPDSVKFSKGDYAAQYTCQLPDGSYITSHHYQGSLADNHKNDTMYIHWDSNFQYIDNMLVHWGGHGASFGVDTPGQTKLPWIWALVEDFNGDNKYYIAHFKYQGGVSKSWKDMTVGEIEQYCQFDSYIRVNYDFKNKLVGVSHANGDYDVLDVSDVVNNTYKPLYTVNVHDYGFNSDKQTYQSQVLDFPYLYWQSGDYDMHDPRTIYCVNVVTGAIEFSHNYEFRKITAIGTHWEPETINVIKGTDQDYLLVSFNFNIQDDSQHTESFWKIPIEYRQPTDLIEKSIEEVGTQ